MKTLQRMLIVGGLYVFVSYVSEIVHELGHVLAAWGTGGQVYGIVISAFSWSYAYAYSSESMALAWSGFAAQVAFGVMVFCLLWICKSRLSLVGVLLAAESLAEAGGYMLVGAITNEGDSATLIGRGIAPVVLIAIGAALWLLSIPVVLPAGALLNMGRGRTRWRSGALVLSPIAAYLGLIVIVNVIRRPDQWLFWMLGDGVGVVYVLLASVVIHLARPWFDGPETRRRMLPVNWRMVAAAAVLGVVVVVASALWLASPSAEASRSGLKLDWFVDSDHYAGRRLREGDRYMVFFKGGQADVASAPRDVRWSAATGKYVVLTVDGLLTVSETGQVETIVEDSLCLIGPLVISPDGRTAMYTKLLSRQGEWFVVVRDIVSGQQAAVRISPPTAPAAFTSNSEAIIGAGDILIKARRDDSGDWSFERTAHAHPDTMVVAVMDGAPVFLDALWSDGKPTDRCRVWYRGRSVEIPKTYTILAGPDRLFALTDDSVRRIDAELTVHPLALPPTDAERIGVGVNSRGLWIAYDDGEVVQFGRTERRFEISLP